MRQLHVIVASVRPGRVGLPVAQWVMAQAAAHGGFAPRLVDLAEVALPLHDEPAHPRLRQYQHAHTQAWSRTVDAADAFVFVTPEYNHGVAPALVNAFDYLLQEWSYKPAGFVSHGGVSAGLRAVQAAKPMVTALRMMPIPDGVAIPFIATLVRKRTDGEDDRFEGNDAHAKAAGVMFDELVRWTDALAGLRRPAGA